jgi:site-specific recombinase XerD
MRHSCASWLVAQGLATRLIAEFLGTSEAMILKHYGHLAPDYQEEAALAIGQKHRIIPTALNPDLCPISCSN